MFFKNLTLFRFGPAIATDLARLEGALAEHRLRTPGPLEPGTKGFLPPVSRDSDGALTFTLSPHVLFLAGREQRMLPASVVNDHLTRKVELIASTEGRKVGGRERKRMKEDLVTELLPHAFIRARRTGAYVDLANGWVVIDSASRKAAEDMLTQVREALGSFPAVPLAPEEGPRVLLTDWLANNTLPAGLAFGDECELRDPATAAGARWRGRQCDLDSEEVKEHLRGGKQVFQLGLVFQDRISFVLGEDLVIRKLRFLEQVVEKLGDDRRDAEAAHATYFSLMSLELANLLARLEKWFGLPRPKGC